MIDTDDVIRASQKISEPNPSFAYNGRGPNQYDCYGLVREILHDLHGFYTPDFTSPDQSSEIAAMMALQLQRWENTSDHAGALISMKLPNRSGHVGLSFGDGRFVHIWERSCGVRIEHISDWTRYILGFHKYVG